MARPPFQTSHKNRPWEIDIDSSTAKDLITGLILEFMEDPRSPGAWEIHPRNLDVLDRREFSTAATAQLMKDGMQAFTQGKRSSES